MHVAQVGGREPSGGLSATRKQLSAARYNLPVSRQTAEMTSISDPPKRRTRKKRRRFLRAEGHHRTILSFCAEIARSYSEAVVVKAAVSLCRAGHKATDLPLRHSG